MQLLPSQKSVTKCVRSLVTALIPSVFTLALTSLIGRIRLLGCIHFPVGDSNTCAYIPSLLITFLGQGNLWGARLEMDRKHNLITVSQLRFCNV